MVQMTEPVLDGSQGVPLDLNPLLSIYGNTRRLGLRIERVPDRARLSRGRNNGDRSWSLSRDDLHDLRYLPAEPMRSVHTLAIRIINLDTDNGATLAVLDFPIAPARGAPAMEDELCRLNKEIAQLKSSLELSQRELADAQSVFDSARSQESSNKAELAEARAVWEAEYDRKLAVVRDQSEARTAAEKKQWESSQNTLIRKIRAEWQDEADRALTNAKEAWKAEEAAKFAQSELQWREQAAQAIAEMTGRAAGAEAALMRAEAEAARLSGDSIELRRLRGELAEASAALNARARELAETRHSLEVTRAEASRGKEEMATARAAWQAELEARLAEAKVSAADTLEALELGADTHVSERQIQDRIEEARSHWKHELEIAVSRAKETWRAEEAARLARAEEQWREKSTRALSESAVRLERAETALARAQAAALHESSDGIELRRTREELSAIRATLADREARLSQAKLEMQRARERWKTESETALAKAHEAWKAEEAYRISVLRGDWQRDVRMRNLEPAVDEREEQPRISGRVIRDGLIATVLAVAVVFLYPTVAPLLEQWLPDGYLPTAEQAIPVAAHAVPSPPPRPAAAAPAQPPPLVVNIGSANVRAEPSNAADIVTTVHLGAKVAFVGRSGSWDRIRIGEGTSAKDGWIFGAYLTSTSAAAH